MNETTYERVQSTFEIKDDTIINDEAITSEKSCIHMCVIVIIYGSVHMSQSWKADYRQTDGKYVANDNTPPDSG